MQPQTKDEMFIVLEKYRQILLQENIKAAPDKSLFSNTSEIPWTYYKKKHYNSVKLSHRSCIKSRNTKTPTTLKKKKYTNFLER